MTNSLIDEETKSKGWPCHSSQEGLIRELLGVNVPVTLTYTVTPKCQCVDAHESNCPEQIA